MFLLETWLVVQNMRLGWWAAVGAEPGDGGLGQSPGERQQVLARLGSRLWWRKQARVRGRVEVCWAA
jgi:hypothetical protein